MKKILAVTAVLLLTVNMLFAQSAGTDFKATSGVTMDVNFTPFNGNSVIGIDALTARYFLSPNTALRMGLHLDYYHDKYDNEKTGNDKLIAQSSTFLIGIHPGIEQHFEGTDRLSPYIGAELILDMFTSKASAEMGNDVYEIKGATDYNGDYENRAYTEIGIGAVAGADFYFARHIYLGAEIGYGFSYYNYGKVEETDNNVTTELTEGKRFDMVLGSHAKGALKLGWKF